MIKKYITLLIILINCQFIQSQNYYQKKCNTTFLVNKEIQEHPEYRKNIQNLISQNKEWIQNNKKNSHQAITIPIVIHVVHRSTHSNIGSGTNISNAQIEDAIKILNEDYSKTNPEFPNPPRNTFVNWAGNPNLEFCLATIDPNGQPTNGITRTSTAKTSFDPDTESNDMKQNSTGGKSGWNPDKYLNIWICDLSVSPGGGMTLGYAYLPGLPNNQKWKDGLVVDFQWFGTTSGTQGDSRTATHEIGHYLGLEHTFAEAGWGWSNPCVDASGNLQCCDNDDSNVDDTPATDGVYWGFVNGSTNNNTCNDVLYGFNSDVLDMDENYMSYSQNTWMFTTGQVNAMISTLNGYRLSLKNSNVATNCTGIIGTYDCIANTCEENLLGNGQYNSFTDCQSECLPASIESIINNIEIYPNPSNGKVIIKRSGNTFIENIIVRNMLGDIIQRKEPINELSINLSNLNSGMYILEIHTRESILFERIILQK